MVYLITPYIIRNVFTVYEIKDLVWVCSLSCLLRSEVQPTVNALLLSYLFVNFRVNLSSQFSWPLETNVWRFEWIRPIPSLISSLLLKTSGQADSIFVFYKMSFETAHKLCHLFQRFFARQPKTNTKSFVKYLIVPMIYVDILFVG